MTERKTDTSGVAARIETDAQLDALYGAPVQPALDKEIDHVGVHYRAYIEAAPFCVLATVGPDGMDCSPRGDPAPLVTVADPKTLLLPDRRGNGRIDALRNLIRDPRISLLFLIPGIDVTIRINGRAEISADADLCARFTLQGKAPKTVIVVTVDRAYFQCPKALVRSRLWMSEAQVDRATLPSTGTMLQALGKAEFDGAAYDAGYAEHMARTIY
ncbi:MAG: pyridoxamine 5'-phosphate oxidase family protein [Pseudomonadota bacterium]